jgi:4-diphosphocytidyl-2C-methyl-D-erythritol kinase
LVRQSQIKKPNFDFVYQFGIPLLSEGLVYKKFDQISIAGDGNCDALIDSLKNERLHAACRTMHNDLEKPASVICTEVKKTIGFLSENGALAAKMTGSGSCVFGVFHSAEAAGKALVNYYGSGTAFFATSKDAPLEIL